MNTRTEPLSNSLPKEVWSIEAPLLERLFDHAPEVAFFIKDVEGRYVSVNQSLLVRHGYKSPAEVIGKRPNDICEGDFGLIPTQQDSEVLRTGRPLIDHLEMQWRQPNKPVWCFTTKIPIRDAEGTITGLIGISRDIRATVEPKDIPAELAAALQEFEHSLPCEFSPSAFANICKLTLPQLARHTKRLFGLTPTQLITKTRVTAATQLLLETDLSVAEIAQRCGYWDHSAFTRKFRSATGATPTAFRKQ